MNARYLEDKSEYFYFVFRVLVGGMFLLHGVQKMPGIIDGSTAVWSLFGLAGIIEVVAGTFVLLGLLTQYTALVAAVEMLVAYFMIHFPNGWSPLVNKGEAALLYLAAFLVLMGLGGRKWALDKYIFR